ncbi:hybrid sensor histidine kinase/response regulator [Anaerolineales bacterium HSG25]|nr:hybrid sensor histidine kinase/response regulator [Anaerolineales bacterium HSG25]
MTKNILVVDDTRANLHLLVEILTTNGYKVRPAANGHMALSAIKAAPPDLILLDIMMPNMSGYQLCEHLKENKDTADIPIIFISALNDTFDKVHAFSIGAVDYVTKPFQVEEMLARVETHLTLQDMNQQLKNEVIHRERINNQLTLEITERKRAETLLREQNQELDAFAHTVAHDLKNPLGFIASYLDYTLDNLDTITDDQKLIFLNEIRIISHKAVSIVDELLLLASVRSDAIALTELDMQTILTDVQKRLAPMVEEYQPQITFPDSWPKAVGYAPWIEEVWTNYFSNGLKYGGRPPHISFGATINDDSNLVRFWIKDNGAGLTSSQQEKLFTEFTRLNQTEVEGTGLGLSIIRRIIKRLGGQVGVESEVGQGSLFYFDLPRSE